MLFVLQVCHVNAGRLDNLIHCQDQLEGLTESVRMHQLQLVGVQDVIHTGGCPSLQGTMQYNQGLLGHAGMQEGMYPEPATQKLVTWLSLNCLHLHLLIPK